MDSDGPPTVSLSMTVPSWHDVIKEPQALAERILAATLMAATSDPRLRAGEVSILLTDDAEIRSLNATYRGKDKATNVLSFPGFEIDAGRMSDDLPVDGDLLLGDVVMSGERLLDEANALKKAPPDHFAHLLVHGALHLLGYDHGDDAEAETMETLETSILKTLGFAEPYEPVRDRDPQEAVSMDAAS